MSKKLNETAMQTELSSSAFFKGDAVQALEPETEVSRNQLRDRGASKPSQTPAMDSTNSGPVTPRHRGPMTPDDVSIPEDPIEAIRRAVKTLGKEDATYRFTAGEKKALADIVYSYASSGIKTSQNEITRIAINNLLEDYRSSGNQSVLVRVLERLNE